MSTEHDKEILNAIFNPLLPTLNGNFATDGSIPDDDYEDESITPEAQEAKLLEMKGIQASEQENYEDALLHFTKAIALAPHIASSYNNRAQAFRLLKRDLEAMNDLNNAINLSHGKGRTGAQAFCQRGLMHLKASRTEQAKADFEAAAKLGSQFGKAQLVQMNPYAALCNKMLRGVFDKVQRGVPTDQDEGDVINESSKKF